MKICALILALAFIGAYCPPSRAFDYSFDNQSFTDQNNDQDNLCIVNGVVVPC